MHLSKQLLKLFLLLAVNAYIFAASYTYSEESFLQVNPNSTRFISGNIAVGGNTVLCLKNESGECTTSDYSETNAEIYLSYIDTDNDDETYNSSSSTISIPSGSKVIWAALFLQGYLHISNDRFDIDTRGDLEEALEEPVLLSTPFHPEYMEIDTDDVNFHLLPNYNWYGNLVGYTYEAMIDLTDKFSDKNETEINGVYTVANVKAHEGRTYDFSDGLGNFGAWTLVIIYENRNEKFRNLSVYHGYRKISENNADETVHIDGFITPDNGPVHAKFFLFTAEGDRNIQGDQFYVNDSLMQNENNDTDNFFDSYITDNIDRYPTLTNNNGIDIKEISIGRDGDESHPQIIGNNVTEVSFRFTSNQDTYFPSMLAASIELYVPKICYLETLYDSNKQPLSSSSSIRVGSTINVSVFIKNDEEYKVANNVRVQYFFSDNNLSYVLNSTIVKDTDWDEPVAFEDNQTISGVSVYYPHSDNDLWIGFFGSGADNEFRPYNENQEYATFEFNATLLTDKPFELKYFTDYSYTIGGQTFTYSGNLPKCTDFNNTIIGYFATPGSFNVVEPDFNSDISPTTENDPLNALKTKIVNKESNFTVIRLGEDLQHLTSYNGLVRVALIDAPQNADPDTCKAAAQNARLIKYVGFDRTSRTSLNNLVFKRINKNATFAISYLVDNDGEVIELSGNTQCLDYTYNCIWGMLTQAYTARYGNECPNGFGNNGEECACADVCSYANRSDTNNAGNEHANEECLECVFGGELSQTVCARDNFAIRPYGFVTFANNYLKRSGEDINVTIKAVDEGNFTLSTGNRHSVIGLADYNESVLNLDLNASIYVPTIDEIKTMNENVYGISSSDPSTVASCPSRGRFTVNPGNFKNGEINATAQFDETGVIILQVSEKPGHEFALVDADDTPDSQRYITKSIKITDPDDISKENLMVFIPYQFTTTATVSTTTGKNWLYITNDVNNSTEYGVTPSMAAYITYYIEAQNKAGNKVLNFTKTCFPDTDEANAPRRNGLKLNSTFDLFLDLWIKPDRNATLYFYTEDNTSNAIWVMTPKSTLEKDKNNSIQEWIGPDKFEYGKGEAKVYFSVERNTSKPVNPLSITIVDANTSTSWMSNIGATNKFNGSRINRTYYFYYARLHIPSQGIEGNDGDIKAYYEIYIDASGSDPAGIKGKESIDDVDWFINRAHTSIDGTIISGVGTAVDPKITLTQKKAIVSGEQNLTFHYSGNTFPYAKTFQVDTNPWLIYDKYDETASKAKGRVVFKRPGDWLGRGKRDFSNDIDTPAPKEENDRILW